MSPLPRSTRFATSAVLSGLLLAAAQLLGQLELLLPAIPLLLLLCSLVVGVYPGCETAVRLSERLAAATRRKVKAFRRAALPRRPDRSTAHGGLLLAFSLSGRAPPFAA